jgi:hypothetical protein
MPFPTLRPIAISDQSTAPGLRQPLRLLVRRLIQPFSSALRFRASLEERLPHIVPSVRSSPRTRTPFRPLPSSPLFRRTVEPRTVARDAGHACLCPSKSPLRARRAPAGIRRRRNRPCQTSRLASSRFDRLRSESASVAVSLRLRRDTFRSGSRRDVAFCRPAWRN